MRRRRAPSTSRAGCSSRTASSRPSDGGDEPEADERVDLERRGRHAGPRQHAPPPVPDAHACASAAGRPVQLAARALSRLGGDRRGGGVRGGAHRARRARPVGLLDRVRPPLRLPARPHRPDRGGGAGGAGARRPDRRLARLDGPRRLRRRPPAGRARRGHRRDRSPTPSGSSTSFTSQAPGRGSRSRSHRARRSP